MSRVLDYIDRAADEFFNWADSNFYDEETGVWKDEHYYGRCTDCNSSPLARLRDAGHSCKIMGVDDDTLRQTGGMDIESGHDWLVVDDRWIVDIWARFYDQFPKAVFDLEQPEDRKFIERAYGPRDTWTVVYDDKSATDKPSDRHWKNWTKNSNQDWDEFERGRSARVVEQLLNS